MRALAVTNPNATSMSSRTRDVIVRALGSELKIDIVETAGRGHAADLAAQARADGFDLVVAVGGDGTVNEVVNGLLRDGPGDDLPRLAVVPGGNANVFARALGLPTEPIEATGTVIERLRAGRERRIGLGLLEADVISGGSDVRSLRRWFTFCVGLGLDAEVVSAVERQRAEGARATPGLFLRTTLAQLGRTDRRHPALTLERTQADDDSASSRKRLFLAVITNTTPWTYFGDRPLEPTPEASFDTGLDVFALRSLRLATTALTVRRLFTGRAPRGRAVVSRHDQARLKFRARRPIAVQVDGEYLGECLTAALHSVPDALAVVC
ncbi:MAG TPA: diacylglycerol kinase family protein [Acidothermaceae bacterium]